MANKKSMTRALKAVPDAGNMFGADPHKRTVKASVLDQRGGVLGTLDVQGVRRRAPGVGSLGAWLRADRALGHRGRQRPRPAHFDLPHRPGP